MYGFAICIDLQGEEREEVGKGEGKGEVEEGVGGMPRDWIRFNGMGQDEMRWDRI